MCLRAVYARLCYLDVIASTFLHIESLITMTDPSMMVTICYYHIKVPYKRDSVLFDQFNSTSSQPVTLPDRKLAFCDIYAQSINSVLYTFPFYGQVHRHILTIGYACKPELLAFEN